MAKKMETSKKLVYISDLITVGLSVSVAYGTFYTDKSMTDLAQVTIASFGETAAAHAFYYWKAKNENRYKYVIRLMRHWVDKHGIDAVIRLADIVLKE